MHALILMIILAPVVLAGGAWHFAGYWNGRYARWSEEQGA